MKATVRSRLKSLLETIGLLGPAVWFLHEVVYVIRYSGMGTLVQNMRYWRRPAGDGLPVPPSRLFYLVAGRRDSAWFLDLGRLGGADVRGALEESKVTFGSLRRILDFGCGCGRVLRQWKDLKGTEVWGTDYNPLLVDWVAKNLKFVRAGRNELAPPLSHESETFDLVYALSVFTHIPGELQDAWLRELRRVIRPGGHLLFTTIGESLAKQLGLNEADRAAFDAGHMVVRRADLAGSNGCASFHPRAYVESHMLGGWTTAGFFAGGSKGTGGQDIWLLRRE